ncbi:MAG: hypothetical protein WCK49_11065, partial [Myxococcaceae bacterium]
VTLATLAPVFLLPEAFADFGAFGTGFASATLATLAAGTASTELISGAATDIAGVSESLAIGATGAASTGLTPGAATDTALVTGITSVLPVNIRLGFLIPFCF